MVEKGFLGAGASSANAGLVNVSQEVPGHDTLFCLLSADMHPEFVAELEAEVDYQRDEYLRVAETDADPEDLIQCPERGLFHSTRPRSFVTTSSSQVTLILVASGPLTSHEPGTSEGDVRMEKVVGPV